MSDEQQSLGKLLATLRERAKELKCLYGIEEILSRHDAPLSEVCEGIVRMLPPGWQYPDVCEAIITVDGNTFRSSGFTPTPWFQSTDIFVQDKVVGSISVYYTKVMPPEDSGPFLKDETKLIETIADRLGHFLTYRHMKRVADGWLIAEKDLSEHRRSEWQVVLDLLRQTDKELFIRVSQKMLNHLRWSGIDEAEQVRMSLVPAESVDEDESIRNLNRPYTRKLLEFTEELSDQAFKIAAEHLSDYEILSRVQKWIQEDKLGFLAQVVNRNLSLAEVTDAIRRYLRLAPEGLDVHSPSTRGIQVSLIRRFLSGQLQYINIAKHYTDLGDFYNLLQKVIYSEESRGRLGGKSAGVHLAAQILHKSKEYADILGEIKLPKTWHITSDMLLYFMHYNNFDEVVEQKYKEYDRVRLEYPYIVQTFKNSSFPPELVKGLSIALDEFRDTPLIVRSSSLLEDRFGAAFSGKYKSLFLANQGPKQKRMEALMDAIAEVYASTFGPDPIEYRSERGLLDFGEEMGIMIQEVVGTRIGDYFFPSLAGVAFSRNEFRWSPRIKREDGLLRLVPGLGTRAVDRTSDDYPILIAPGQPGLRANVSVDEVVRYTPKKIDVINLKTNSFETIALSDLLRMHGHSIPGIEKMVSIFHDGRITEPSGLGPDFEHDDIVVTFEGLITKTPFIRQIQTMLKLLEEKLGSPVDIEFATDGKDFYLLQCRPQSSSDDSAPSPIPHDVPYDDIVFSANRYVSNGRVPDITHIVYVDPVSYSSLGDVSELLAVGRAVSKLNELLPKRQFILMGPGRWGSRGDIRLGVSVTYSDINNTAVLIEVARQKGNYVPDLSFGTHFFQDLVESNIRYLPLYPDDSEVAFNQAFLRSATNFLPRVLPDFAHLSDTVKLIDVPWESGGRILRVLLNAEQDQALAFICDPKAGTAPQVTSAKFEERHAEHYWRWRLGMAEHIASLIDGNRFGVVNFYIFGSTKNGTAGPASDIDILVHFRGTEAQRKALETWLEGWSLCLGEINYLQTGCKTEGLLDVHIVTDHDIAGRTSFAAKIGAATDPARPLPLGHALIKPTT
jgi:hypothetical protein